MKKEFKIPKVRLFLDRILTSVEADKVLPSGIIVSADELGVVHTKQTVLATGPNSTIQIGQEVEINFDLFPVKNMPPKHGVGPDSKMVILPIEIIDNEKYLFISTREIKWVYQDEEVGEVLSNGN